MTNNGPKTVRVDCGVCFMCICVTCMYVWTMNMDKVYNEESVYKKADVVQRMFSRYTIIIWALYKNFTDGNIMVIKEISEDNQKGLISHLFSL